MILRTTFENIYSIKDETQISFVAGKSNAHPSHVSRAEKRDDISVLKAGIVYGANASGKSNVIKAIALLQQDIAITVGENGTERVIPAFARTPRHIEGLAQK